MDEVVRMDHCYYLYSTTLNIRSMDNKLTVLRVLFILNLCNPKEVSWMKYAFDPKET